MEKNSKKVKEPFNPEDTPRPPQIIDPEERDTVKEKRKAAVKQPKNDPGNKTTSQPGSLGDNAEIDDETTI